MKKTVIPIIVLYAVLAVSFAGCRSTARNDDAIDDSDVITVEIGEIPDESVDISEFVDSVEFLKLETGPESLIAEISSVVLVDSMVIVVDGRANRLLFFDHNGKYLRKIERLGRAPQEYLDITKVLWDEQNEELALYDIATRKMLFYTLDGKFIRSIDDFNGRSVIRDIVETSDGGYLCYREDRSKGPTEPDNLSGLWKVDSLGDFERFLIDRTTIYPSLSSQFVCNIYPLNDKGEIGLFDQYSADIYHTDGQSISKYMKFELPGKMPIDFPNIATVDNIREPVYSMVQHAEKGDMVFTTWAGQDAETFFSLYSKRDGTVRTGRGVSLTVDGEWIPVPIYVSTNSPFVMASVLPATMILSIIETAEAPDYMKTSTKRLVSGMEQSEIEGMNPVLTLVHIKNAQKI